MGIGCVGPVEFYLQGRGRKVRGADRYANPLGVRGALIGALRAQWALGPDRVNADFGSIREGMGPKARWVSMLSPWAV